MTVTAIASMGNGASEGDPADGLRLRLEKSERRIRELEAELQSARSETDHEALFSRLREAEKMAFLGTQVASIAHEINTPVGIGVTAASYIREKVSKLQQEYAAGTMRRSTLDTFIKNCSDSSDIVLRNLERASDLIRSFKQVAVDQSSHAQRTFILGDYLQEILLTLRPRLKQSGHKIVVECPDNVRMDSYPGAFSQVITNLVQNSLIHGFSTNQHGTIRIEAVVWESDIIITFKDDGCGIPEALLEKVFDPHFTTRRDDGGSGLGLNIIRELVTGTLGGTITLQSTEGAGLRFDIQLPMEAAAYEAKA